MYTTTSSPRSLHEYSFGQSREESYRYSTDSSRFSRTPNSLGSPITISEVMNPDGSVTIRSVDIHSDGSWTKREQQINAQRRERLLRREYLSQNGAMNFERQNRIKVVTEEVDPSEAIAHELRRQRLAQSSSFLADSSSTSTAGSRNPRRAQHDGGNPAITLSPGPFRGSRMMNTETYSPTYSPTNYSNTSTPSSRLKHGSKKSRSRNKHVVFSEPLTPPRFQPREVPTEEPISSTKVVNKVVEKPYGYYYHSKMSNPILDVYSDLDSQERAKLKQSFSSGDSIFDDVPPTSNVGTALENTYVGGRSSSKNRSKISYADSDIEQQIPNLYSVTVTKTSASDRIGIFVHRENFAGGHRLVVSKVAPDGKFADTKIKEGDVVVSINGEDMTSNPSLERALSIVTSATDSVTIVVHENVDVNTSQSDVNDSSQSVDQTTISSISKDQSSLAYGKGYSPKYERNQESFRGRENPDSFATNFENEKPGAKAAAKSGQMTMDGSMLVTKNSEIAEPLSIKINESWKVSGVMVINIETESSELEDPGLRFGTKKTSSGYVTFIADISPASVFKQTPLRTGDIVVSINRVSFFDNADIFDAYAALWKSEKRITLVAKKGEASLNQFLLSQRGQANIPHSKALNESHDTALTDETSGTMGSAASGRSKQSRSSLSDERISSEASQSSRTRETPTGDSNVSSESNSEDEESNSSRRIKITKNRHDEFLGLELSEATTTWGKLLTVSNIIPGSKAASSELKIGDVILTVNGISFKNNPNAARAISLLRKSQKEVVIEFQKLSSFSAAVRADMQKSLNLSEDSELLANSLISHGDLESQKVKKKRQKVLVTVTKDRPGQKIGLDFALVDDKLVVTDISSKGLLRNAPLFYGDTILSINGVSFAKEPVAKEAYNLVKNAPKKVTLEILKVQYDHKKPDNIGVATKSCIPGPLLCGRRKKTDPEYIAALKL